MRRLTVDAAPGAWERAVFFAAGLAISVLMVARSQVTIDQFNLLARGWHFAVLGEWVPYGVWASGGGYHPGGLISLLVGLPLLVWQDHRAPTVLILASHVLAYLLLHAALRRALRPFEQVLFAVLYWLSPWRLFFSGFLWNPNYLFLAGAVHLWTAYRSRRCPGFWVSFLHVVGLGLALQVHVSALILVVASLLLWWRGYLRLDLGGALTAGCLVVVSLVPWSIAMVASPERLPISSSSVGHGILTLEPVLQGVAHWLRFAAAGLNRSMVSLDFTGLNGPGFDSIGIALLTLRGLVSAATIALAGWANVRLWRRAGNRWGRLDDDASERAWLEGAVRWSFLGALLVFALSPIGVSGHGLLSVVHLAVLPVALGVGSLALGPHRRLMAASVRAYAVAMVVVGVGLALGSPAYRCGGYRGLTAHFMRPALLADHRMFDELRIRQSCPLVIDDRAGWWPDGLRPLAAPDAVAAWDNARLDTRGWLEVESADRRRSPRATSAGGAQR